MDIEKTLSQMTLKQKIAYCTGADFWNSKRMEELGIPSFRMSDGPNGLRCQLNASDMMGVHSSEKATCFPTAVTSGATWDPTLLEAEGMAIGQEAAALGVHVVLGPGCNIKRDPLCGRNFEYFSEDPYVSGEMAAAFIRGVQSTGRAASLKHFAMNNQEFMRMVSDSRVDERAMREIYLAPFERAVKTGRPETVMCSYNKINGQHASDCSWLLTEVLRKEWGFDGMVVTDWGAMNDRIKAFEAGCDLNMPGGSRYMEKKVLDAVCDGSLSENTIDASVRRILKIAEKAEHPRNAYEDTDHHTLAKEIALAGAVLLKNDGHALPASRDELVLIGSMAERFRYQGSGSSHIVPKQMISLTEALPDVPYLGIGGEHGEVSEEEILRAAEIAGRYAKPVVVAGLPESYECESFDRTDMKMPEGSTQLIRAVAATNPNAVVLLLGGSSMETEWIEEVAAVLFMGLSGEAGGEAAADLLLGKANPSGKLTESWPMRYEDVPCRDTFATRDPEYRESIYVGYRYYDKAGVSVRFPFGHGLSYTTFAYSNIQAKGREILADITNTGDRTGAETVQLYIAPITDGIHRPVRELRGFRKVELRPGETKTVCFELDKRCFSVWQNGWHVPAGKYMVELGSSSRDIRMKLMIRIEGEKIPTPEWQTGSWYEKPCGTPDRAEWLKLPDAPKPENKDDVFTTDSSLTEMLEGTSAAHGLRRVLEFAVSKATGLPPSEKDPAFCMMMTMAQQQPVRGLVINGKGFFTDGMADMIVHTANKHRKKR